MMRSWRSGSTVLLEKDKLFCLSLFFVAFFLAVSLTSFAQPENESPISFEGELANSIDNDFIDGSLVTKTELVTELEWGDNFSLDIEFTNEYDSDAEDTSELELDLEVLPGSIEKELVLYLEPNLARYDSDETVLGMEATLGDTDYDLGMDLKESEKNFYMDFYRWFDAGFSLGGGLELGNGPEFKNSSVAIRGAPVSINDADWDLSGELEATLEESLFGETEYVKLSFSLENENTDYFRFPKRSEGVSFYSLTPLNSGEYAIVLFNPGEKLNLKGWSIGNTSNFHEISKQLFIQPGQKQEIKVGGNIVDDIVQLQIRNPNGKVKDTWRLPRFYFGNNQLFRREGSLERQIELSFKDNEFDELVANWDLEVPTGPDSYLYGVLELDHTGHFGKGEVGYRGPRNDLDISLLDEEIEINYYPRMKSGKYRSEVSLELNTVGEFETAFEIEQDLEDLEITNSLVFSSDQEENDIKLDQEMEWEEMELALAYLFEDYDFAEFEIEAGFVF